MLPEEASIPPRLEGNEGRVDSVIEILVMAKKSGDVVRSLMQLRHRLTRESTIVIIHNGMGALAEVQAFWPKEAERPNIVVGFSTHGLSKREEFTVDHWGHGKIHLSIAPRLDESDIFSYTAIQQDSLPAVISRFNAKNDIRLQYLERGKKYKSLLYILQQFLANEPLNCTLRAYFPHFYLLQLRRTALQSILQTLGTLQRCTNSQLIKNRINHKIIGRLILELLPVLHTDPLIASSPQYLSHFSFQSLYSQVRIMALTNPHHMNALAQDVAGKRENDLPYFSGFLLRLASQRGKKLAMWRTLHEQVKALALAEQMKANEVVPIVKAEGGIELPEWTYDVAERYWKLDRYDEVVDTIRQPTAVEMMEKETMEARIAENIDDMAESLEDGGVHDLERHTAEEEEVSSSESAPSSLTRRLRFTSEPEDSTRERTLVNFSKLGFDSEPKGERIEPTSRFGRSRLIRSVPTKPRNDLEERHVGDTKEVYPGYQALEMETKNDTMIAEEAITGPRPERSSPPDGDLGTEDSDTSPRKFRSNPKNDTTLSRE